MIFDCFNFFNEVDVLDIRLHTLDKIVDKFIIAEATVTHTNRPKPLNFLRYKKRFQKFKDKIIYTVIDDSPDVTTPWIIINHQMSAVTRDLAKLKPKPSDTILISSVDEIPKPERVIEWKDKPGKHKVFLQTLSNYYLNCVDYSNYGNWEGACMFNYKDLRSYQTPYIARFTRPDVKIHDGGWHFSWIGDLKYIRYKMESMAHQEYNNDKFNTPEHIIKSINEGKDFLDHKLKFKIEKMELMPEYVQQNRTKFSRLLIEDFKKKSLLYSMESLALDAKKMARVQFRRLRRKITNEG